jgi:cell shape-determining protein MreD
MSWLNTVFVLVATFLAVFWAAAFQGIRHLLGAQVDLLPALMIYAALCGSLTSVCLAAGVGGLLFDSLSANPLGISILPLFVVGFATHLCRDLILRDQAFAQTVLGLAAGLAVPVLQLLLLLTSGRSPQLGWGTLWQLAVMTAGGAVATPVCFFLSDWLKKHLTHSPAFETSFRPDREIRRGR